MSEKPQRPRGATGSEADVLRATVKAQPRQTPLAVRSVLAGAPAPPGAAEVAARSEVERQVEEGRALLASDPKEAHRIFERAHHRNTNDVRAMSHYGLTLVMVEGDRQRGIRFCEEAVRRGPVTTELLCNLAQALVQTRNKEQAVKALRKAQELAPDDPRVGAAFVELGLRRPPPIGWLPRTSLLNKWIGKLTWLFGRRKNPVADQP